MLWASKRWPQDIGALVYLDGEALIDPTGRFRIEVVREAIGRGCISPRGSGRSSGAAEEARWTRVGGRSERRSPRARSRRPAAGRERRGRGPRAHRATRSRRLDPSRPLWEVWFLPGLSDGRVAMYVRLHHSLADGMAAMRTIDRFLDAEPDPATSAPPWTPAAPPTGRDLRDDHLRRRRRKVRRTLGLFLHPLSTLAAPATRGPRSASSSRRKPADRTSLDRTVGPAAGSR